MNSASSWMAPLPSAAVAVWVIQPPQIPAGDRTVKKQSFTPKPGGEQSAGFGDLPPSVGSLHLPHSKICPSPNPILVHPKTQSLWGHRK